MRSKSFVFVILSVILLGCAQKHSAGTKQDIYEGKCDDNNQSIGLIAIEAWKYAQLSKNVYKKESCQYNVKPFFEHIDQNKSMKLDFYSDLYRDKNDQKLVLVFRGTDHPVKDFISGMYPKFWKVNNTAQNGYALKVFDLFEKKHKEKIKVVAGHSLGGGIAMHVSLHKDNLKTFSFNGSPVFKKDQENERINERYSIVENGDWLKIFRAPGREATQCYTSLNCISGKIDQHGITELANCLTYKAAMAGDKDAKKSLAIEHKGCQTEKGLNQSKQ